MSATEQERTHRKENVMKEYTEYTREEIKKITARGGDECRKLNKMTADYLDNLDLSDRARDIISDTDFNCLALCFGGMLTAEEIEEYIKDEYGEEE